MVLLWPNIWAHIRELCKGFNTRRWTWHNCLVLLLLSLMRLRYCCVSCVFFTLLIVMQCLVAAGKNKTFLLVQQSNSTPCRTKMGERTTRIHSRRINTEKKINKRKNSNSNTRIASNNEMKTKKKKESRVSSVCNLNEICVLLELCRRRQLLLFEMLITNAQIEEEIDHFPCLRLKTIEMA